ncbi:MAG TPA: AAA family ATPase, partial [Marmoricola sp.]|nr:AAA family ATPase [Marmoricola sp.]
MNEEITAGEIAREQEFVDSVYQQLGKAADSAQALAREGLARGHVGHEGGLVERDAMVYQAARRIASLDAAHEGLVFGRLDMAPEVSAEPRYVGRIGLRDDNYDAMLIDWRAPAAGVFYQATPADPMQVLRRRILRTRGETVLGVEDELLDPERGSDLVIVGEGALMAQLSRARDRSMHSIVATIQAEQDRAIRAPGKGVVLISGGPGTGKTVVALHRAAFLLYGDRRRYEGGGVLIVGPSGVFMRYIERVLPSLGETSAALRSLGEVVDGIRATRRDLPAVSAIKGASRMAEVLRRTARQAVPGSPTEFRAFYRDAKIVLGPRELGQIRRDLLSLGPRNRSTTRVASTLIEAMWSQVSTDRALERTQEDFSEEMRDRDDFLQFAAAWWPVLDASTVLGWLADTDFLKRVSQGILDDAEVSLLAGSFETELSVDDVALLDELRYRLGDPPLVDDEDEDPLGLADSSLHEVTTVADREYAGPRGWRPPTNRIEDDGFAHVLIDEAQDLTPMQWRMVGRRGRAATWTIVGDPAQSSWPDPAEAQTARDLALKGKDLNEFHLSTNYRNSKEIYDYAAAYAQRVGLSADLPTAVRATGVLPQDKQVSDLEVGLSVEVDRMLNELEGTIGIVVPVARLPRFTQWLAERTGRAQDGDSRVVVLGGLDTKGLEFDGIVVVDPAGIEAESPTGRATLYVVLTRATQQMVTL